MATIKLITSTCSQVIATTTIYRYYRHSRLFRMTPVLALQECFAATGATITIGTTSDTAISRTALFDLFR